MDRIDYLVSCLTDDAKKCIQNVSITNENYKVTWDRLVERYDNKRAIITSCLNDLFQMKPMPTESSSELKTLRDGTREPIDNLKSLSRPVDKWGDLLVHLTVMRLDLRTLRDWETQLGRSTNPPTFKELDVFLYTPILALERYEECNQLQLASAWTLPNIAGTKPGGNQSRVHAQATSQPRAVECSYCKLPHYVAKCSEFNTINLEERRSFIASNRLCFNCIGPHLIRDCRSLRTCLECRGRHHNSLHDPSIRTNTSTSAPAKEVDAHVGIMTSAQQTTGQQLSDDGVSVLTTSTQSICLKSTWLATARVIVKTESQSNTELRALINPCSEASFITESAVRRLSLLRIPVFVPVSGIGCSHDHAAKSKVRLNLTSTHALDKEWPVNALVLPCLTDYLPTPRPLNTSLSFLKGLSLADPYLESKDPIELLLGIDIFTKIIEDGLQKNQDGSFIAQKTSLGWVLSGSPNSLPSEKGQSNSCVSAFQCSIDLDLSTSLQRFWEQEEVDAVKHSLLTLEEQECEEHFLTTSKRDNNGRYILRLPFQYSKEELGISHPSAKAMLLRMESRFTKDPKLLMLYREFMSEYLSPNHMRLSTIAPDEEETRGFYLPHHGVSKTTEDTSKLCVVFNGSIKLPSGRSLNDCLHVGQKLLSDVTDILLPWRMHRIVFYADVVKAFRQIKIADEDLLYQKILWRNSPTEPIKTYLLTTVTYGLASSRFKPTVPLSS